MIKVGSTIITDVVVGTKPMLSVYDDSTMIFARTNCYKTLYTLTGSIDNVSFSPSTPDGIGFFRLRVSMKKNAETTAEPRQSWRIHSISTDGKNVIYELYANGNTVGFTMSDSSGVISSNEWTDDRSLKEYLFEIYIQTSADETRYGTEFCVGRNAPTGAGPSNTVYPGDEGRVSDANILGRVVREVFISQSGTAETFLSYGMNGDGGYTLVGSDGSSKEPNLKEVGRYSYMLLNTQIDE